MDVVDDESPPLVPHELQLLSEFSETTRCLGFRLRAAERLHQVLHWTNEHRLECQLELHRWGAVSAALDVIRNEGLTSTGLQSEILQATAWRLIAAVVLCEPVAEATARENMSEMLNLARSVLANLRTDRFVVEACLLALNNLCFCAHSARLLLIPIVPAVLWLVKQRVGDGIVSIACLLMSNVAKHVGTHAVLTSNGAVDALTSMALDSEVPIWLRGPAMATLSRLDATVRMQLLNTDAIAVYFAPTMQAAVERSEGPAGNLPGLDHAEHFALFCSTGPGASRCVEHGVVPLLQDVLLCEQKTASHRIDLEGKRWALEALAQIAKHPTLHSHIRRVTRKSKEALRLKSELENFQSSEHVGVRRAAVTLFCRVRRDWVVMVLLCGHRMSTAGLFAPRIWQEHVLPYVIGDDLASEVNQMQDSRHCLSK